jgi:hypothetical protein
VKGNDARANVPRAAGLGVAPEYELGALDGASKAATGEPILFRAVGSGREHLSRKATERMVTEPERLP